MTDDLADDLDAAELKRVHGVTTALRDRDLTVGFDTDDYVADFDAHVADAHETLRADDLSAFFTVAHREGQTDYAASVCVDHPVAWGHIQIEMLAAHFKTVHDALPLDATELVEAVLDEAVTLEDDDAAE